MLHTRQYATLTPCAACSDNDSIPDAVEGHQDCDVDGYLNFLDDDAVISCSGTCAAHIPQHLKKYR
jgi:hypothetical protein